MIDKKVILYTIKEILHNSFLGLIEEPEKYQSPKRRLTNEAYEKKPVNYHVPTSYLQHKNQCARLKLVMESKNK